MDEHSPKLATSGRGRGVIVGSFIALGWAYYGAAIFGHEVRAAALAIVAILTAMLVRGGFRLVRDARAMPPATPAEIAVGKRKRRWFWLNFVVEVILLNIAIGLLGAPGMHIYWIAAISAVVGLHFLPMAWFFRIRSYGIVGVAMMAGAALGAFLTVRHPDRATDFAQGEALANAAILWCALGMGVLRAARVSHGSSDHAYSASTDDR